MREGRGARRWASTARLIGPSISHSPLSHAQLVALLILVMFCSFPFHCCPLITYCITRRIRLSLPVSLDCCHLLTPLSYPYFTASALSLSPLTRTDALTPPPMPCLLPPGMGQDERAPTHARRLTGKRRGGEWVGAVAKERTMFFTSSFAPPLPPSHLLSFRSPRVCDFGPFLVQEGAMHTCMCERLVATRPRPPP